MFLRTFTVLLALVVATFAALPAYAAVECHGDMEAMAECEHCAHATAAKPPGQTLKAECCVVRAAPEKAPARGSEAVRLAPVVLRALGTLAEPPAPSWRGIAVAIRRLEPPPLQYQRPLLT